MTEATPRHIGDMEESIETVEVDESPEVGEVLDRALANIAGHHLGQQGGSARVPFVLNDLTSAKDNILTIGIKFNDLELVRIANEN